MNDKQGELFTPVIGLGQYREVIAHAPMVRNVDPVTSRQAAKNARLRVGSQQWQVLAAYGNCVDMTADEAGQVTLLANKPGCCYWHRVSDLLKHGYLVDTGAQRVARSGELQRVNRITDTGRARLATYGI